MWYYVQPPLASLGLAASVAAEAATRKLRGAALLNLLHSRHAAVAGDVAARGLLGKLLRAGCAPYFKMLERWLCEGVLDDPFCEFMVQDNPVSLLGSACAVAQGPPTGTIRAVPLGGCPLELVWFRRELGACMLCSDM